MKTNWARFGSDLVLTVALLGQGNLVMTQTHERGGVARAGQTGGAPGRISFPDTFRLKPTSREGALRRAVLLSVAPLGKHGPWTSRDTWTVPVAESFGRAAFSSRLIAFQQQSRFDAGAYMRSGAVLPVASNAAIRLDVCKNDLPSGYSADGAPGFPATMSPCGDASSLLLMGLWAPLRGIDSTRSGLLEVIEPPRAKASTRASDTKNDDHNRREPRPHLR